MFVDLQPLIMPGQARKAPMDAENYDERECENVNVTEVFAR
jgi:hypothetical protein